MKKHFLVLILLSLLAVSLFAQRRKKQSWYEKQPKGFVFIPMGTCTYQGDSISVDAFWMMETEVTNELYAQFLEDLRKTGTRRDLGITRVKSEKWSEIYKGQFKDFSDHYFKNKSFGEYPVVNVSYEAALLFCKWYTKKLNEKEKAHSYAEVRLPSKEEWAYAAKGGDDRNLFSWSGPFLRDNEGLFMANFKSYAQRDLKWDKEKQRTELVNSDEVLNTKESKFNRSITAPVKTYKKNGYGLYNMCGNVAEMTAKPGEHIGGSWGSPGYNVRVESEDMYEGITDGSPFIGFRVVVSFIGHAMRK